MLDLLISTWYYTSLVLGIFTVTVWIYRTLCVWLRSFGFGKKLSLQRYGKGSWAVVTGATDGIGK